MHKHETTTEHESVKDVLATTVKDLLALYTEAGHYRNSFAFSPDSRSMALGIGELLLLDVATSEVRKLESMRYLTWGYLVSFSPNGQRLASGGTGLKVWDVASGRLLRTFMSDSRNLICSAAFSTDGARLASGSMKLSMWDVSTGKQIEVLDNCVKYEVNCMVLSVAFSPGGRWLASGTQEGTLRLWNLNAIRLKSYIP